MQAIHLIAGLPRSGSALLANVLAQNPRFTLAGTSPLVDLMLGVRNNWDRLHEALATPFEDSERAKLRVLRGMFFNYFPKGVISFDRSRSWLAHLEMVEAVLGKKVKVIAPIRDIRDILASKEKMWRRLCGLRQIPYEAADYYSYQTLQGRCESLMAPNGEVGIAYRRLHDVFQRGLGDRVHMVNYDTLTGWPQLAIEQIYDFLGEEAFDHDFENVEQTIEENDRVYGLPGLHDIRPKIESQDSQWDRVLGDVAEAWAHLNGGYLSGVKGFTPDQQPNGQAVEAVSPGV